MPYYTVDGKAVKAYCPLCRKVQRFIVRDEDAYCTVCGIRILAGSLEAKKI